MRKIWRNYTLSAVRDFTLCFDFAEDGGLQRCAAGYRELRPIKKANGKVGLIAATGAVLFV
jgi:hypothetical protein